MTAERNYDLWDLGSDGIISNKDYAWNFLRPDNGVRLNSRDIFLSDFNIGLRPIDNVMGFIRSIAEYYQDTRWSDVIPYKIAERGNVSRISLGLYQQINLSEGVSPGSSSISTQDLRAISDYLEDLSLFDSVEVDKDKHSKRFLVLKKDGILICCQTGLPDFLAYNFEKSRQAALKNQNVITVSLLTDHYSFRNVDRREGWWEFAHLTSAYFMAAKCFLAALLLLKNPTLTNEQLNKILADYGTPFLNSRQNLIPDIPFPRQSMLVTSTPEFTQGTVPSGEIMVYGQKYQILQVLQGGQSWVYKARNMATGRVEMLREPKSESSGASFSQKALEEARLLTNIPSHPSVQQIYWVAGEHTPRPFLCGEWIEGNSLNELVGQTGLPEKKVHQIALQIAQALEHVHTGFRTDPAKAGAAAPVHRDLKPDNIMIENGGRVVIVDWGLGKRAGQAEKEGTPEFCAPEQIGGQAYPSSDNYALGIIIINMLTGEETRPYNFKGTLLERFPELKSLNNPNKQGWLTLIEGLTKIIPFGQNIPLREQRWTARQAIDYLQFMSKENSWKLLFDIDNI